ncbi:DUF2909 domain-containing protein [Permianibacter aggregans]|uniref:DUF2909 family protein n=1 Tax=Permianibacter aggregans TaxID=1510150 RepID=A0A4R6UMT0_9GAMM|nr:DUF2909 domain-containing protein [Permianibacter aggregans]TDQ48410.1 DUF2909 family protein [Permianibacter aggregans]
MLIAKIVLVLLLIGMLIALFRGLFFLTKDHDKPGSKRLANSLAWRVGIAALLILVIVLSIRLGILVPHGVGG